MESKNIINAIVLVEIWELGSAKEIEEPNYFRRNCYEHQDTCSG